MKSTQRFYIKTLLKGYPVKCSDCPFSNAKIEGFHYYRVCLPKNKVLRLQKLTGNNAYAYLRPKWCPLRKIEEKDEIKEKRQNIGGDF